MTCINTIPSPSNTLKNLVVNEKFHSSYIKKEFNDKKEIIIKIFGAYFVPLLKDINHPEFLQWCKLYLYDAVYEKNIYANLSKPSDKKGIYLHDSDMYWPTTIKYKIQWFPFLAIMEHTANLLNTKQGLVPSWLNIFSMFGLRLIYDRDKMEDVAIRYINCKKETGLYL